jgi:hypothetical protein
MNIFLIVIFFLKSVSRCVLINITIIPLSVRNAIICVLTVKVQIQINAQNVLATNILIKQALNAYHVNLLV